MPIPLNDNFAVAAGKHIDSRYLDGVGPYFDIKAAETKIPLSYRYRGLTVLIGSAGECWWRDGTGDGQLVLKQGSGNCLQVTQKEFNDIPVKDNTIRYFISETGDGTQVGSFVIGQTISNVAPASVATVNATPLCTESIFFDTTANPSNITFALPTAANSNAGDIKMIQAWPNSIVSLTVSNSGNPAIVIEGSALTTMVAGECYSWQCRLKVGANVYWRRLS